MLVQIIKKNNWKRGQFFLYGCLCASNLFTALYMFLSVALARWLSVKGENNKPLDLFTVACRCIIICCNCGFNLAIAYSRLCVFTKPLKYPNAILLRQLNKKLALVVIVVTFVIALLNVIAKAVTKMREISTWSTTIVLGATDIALCTIYCKLIWEHRIWTNNSVQTLEAGTNKEIIEARKRQKRYITRLFISTTSSFLVLNLPLMFIPHMTSLDNPTCSSTEGKLALFAVTCTMVNMVLDPVWFFISLYRIQKTERAEIVRHTELAVLPGNCNNSATVVGQY